MNEALTHIPNNNWGSLEGRILVASKALDGSCFEKSLIYICAHDDSGAIGVIINREVGHFTIKEILEEADQPHKLPIAKLNKKMRVLFGGPVDTGRTIILSMSREQEQHFNRWHSLTIHTNAEQFLQDYIDGEHDSKFIVTKGMAAWDVDQLEKELGENSWLVVDVDDPKLIFSHQSKKKWEKVIKSIGVNFDNLVGYSGNC